MLRRTLVISAMVVATVVLAVPAIAGNMGGAIVTLDHAPDEFRAGEAAEVMYTVLWLGDDPLTGPSSLEFRPAKGTDGSVGGLRFEATPTKTPGQYIAEVTLPASGTWLWSARHSRGWTDLGSLDVTAMSLSNLLDHDGLALAAVVVLGTGLMLLLARAEPELRPAVFDHGSDVAPEGA